MDNFLATEALAPVGFIVEDTGPTDPGTGGGDGGGHEGDGLPVFTLTIDQAINMTDGVLTFAGDYALEIFYDELTFTDVKQLVPAVFIDGNWSRQVDVYGNPVAATALSSTLFPTTTDVDNFLATEALAPVGFIVEDTGPTDPGTGGGDGGGHEGDGLPVFTLTIDQAINMTDGVLTFAGDYALEIFFDELTFTDVKQLVPAVFIDGNWSRQVDVYGNPVAATALSSTLFPTTTDVDNFLATEALAPVGFIVEDTDPTDPGTGGGDGGGHEGDGLPVFTLTIDQAINMTDGVLTFAGDYALEIFFDELTFTGVKQLVPAVFIDGNWSRQVDVYGNPVAATALSSTLFPTTTDVDNFLATEALAPVGFIVEDTDPTDPGTGGGDGGDHEGDGLPVFTLTIDQAINMTDGVLTFAGDYALEIFFDELTFTDVRQLVPAVFIDGNWSRQVDVYGNPVAATALSSTLFPTTTDVDNFLATEALAPVGFIVEDTDPTDPGTGGGDGGGDHVGDGLPVFTLTTDQAINMTDGVLTFAGDYALEIFFDELTFTDVKQLVPAVFIDGNWSRQVDVYGNPVAATALSSTLFPTTTDVDNFLATEALAPVGFIVEDTGPTDPGTGGGDGGGHEGDGLPVFTLTIDQAINMTDGVLTFAGDYALEIFFDELTFTDVRQLVPAVFIDGNWSRQVDVYGNPVAATALSSTLFPTTTDVDNFLATEALAPVGFIVEDTGPTDPGTGGGDGGDHNQTDPGTDPGDGNYTDPGTGDEGIPVFALTGEQTAFLTDAWIVHPGNFAIDVFIDPFTYTESMHLIEVYDHGFGWEPVLDYNEQPLSTPLSTAFFPTVQDLDFYMMQQDLNPIGFIHHIGDPGTDPGTDPGDGNYTDPGTGDEGIPVFALTGEQTAFLTDAWIVHPGNFAIDVFIDPFTYTESMHLIEVYDHGFGWQPVLDYNEQPLSTPLSPAFFPTVQDLDFYMMQQDLNPIGFIHHIGDPGTDPGTDPGDGNYTDPGTGDDGIPVFALTGEQTAFLTDAWIVHPGNFAIDVFIDPFTYTESMHLIEVYDHGFGWQPVLDYNEQPLSTPLSPAFFPTVEDLDFYMMQQDLNPIGFIHHIGDPGTDPGTDPGDGNYTDPGTGDEGIPVFALTGEQTAFLTDAWIVHPGNFAIDVFIDPFTYTESMHLIEVYDHGFGWQPVLDYNEQPLSTPLSPAFFLTVQDLDFYMMQQDLNPIGFIHHIGGPGTGHEILPPVVRTSESFHNEMYFGEVSLRGEILYDGNSQNIEKGFLISDNIRFDFAERYFAYDNFNQELFFEVRVPYLEPGKTYFYRAYAMNEAGETLGNIKKLTISKDHFSQNPWEWIPEMAGGWRESHWFGAFLLTKNDWMYHAELGWIYTQSDYAGGHWIWLESHGWLWTKENTWPFLYSHQLNDWLYFVKNKEGYPVFFNYHQNQYQYLPY